MGRSAEFYCCTCRVWHDLGYGSATTWLDHCRTVEAFDAAVTADPDLGTRVKNQRVRAALVRHAGHETFTHSRDWTHTHEEPHRLCGEFGPMGGCVTIIHDFGDWREEPLEPGIDAGA